MKYQEIIATSGGQQRRPTTQPDRGNLPISLDSTFVEEPINRLYVDLMNALDEGLMGVESVPRPRQ
jgi:hypothetical protein